MRLLLLTLCFSTATAMRHRAIGRSMVRHRNNVASAKAARTDPALAKQGWLLCPPSNSGCFSALWGGSGSGFSCPKETEELKVPKRKFVNEDIKKKMNALVKAGFNAMTKEEREALVSGARSRVTGRQMMGPGKLGQANALRRNAAFEQQVAFGGIGASSLLKDMEREDAYENTCRCGAGSPPKFDLYSQVGAIRVVVHVGREASLAGVMECHWGESVVVVVVIGGCGWLCVEKRCVGGGGRASWGRMKQCACKLSTMGVRVLRCDGC